jgi:hypothetical protein
MPVLRLNECADPAAAESAAKLLHSIAGSTVELLQSVADSTTDGSAPTETS